MLKVYVSTNGCVDGQLSSKRVEEFFRINELTITKNVEEADLIVFYACGLTEQKEKEALSVIQKFRGKMKNTAKLHIWGCLPKINPQSLSTIYDGPIIGPLDTNFFEEILEKNKITFNDIKSGFPANKLVSRETSEQNNQKIDPLTNAILLPKQSWTFFRSLMRKQNKTFFIKIATGCTGHCTYCSERQVFGRIKSRPIGDIISEFKEGLKLGCNRFSLLATDLSAYGKDIDCSLCDVLREMIRTNNKINFKIILNQLELFNLKEIYSDLEEILASGKIEELMCPVQSGSNRILKLMGRNYTAEEWKSYMLRINKQFPNIRLSTQFLVGFPTETDEDFRKSLKLLDRPLNIDGIYIFKFSKRPTINASNISGQISEETKELRYKKLLQKHARMNLYNFLQFKPKIPPVNIKRREYRPLVGGGDKQ